MSDEHAHDEAAGPQVVAMIATFSITMLFGLPPILSKKFDISKKAISLSNVFSAGIFLSLGFMLFLPEANELFNNHFKSEESHEEHGGGAAHEEEEEGNKQYFPVAFLLALITYVGFFLTDKFFHLKSEQVQNPQTQLSEVKVQAEDNVQSEVDNKKVNLTGKVVALSSYMILFSLGIHSLLDGIAIGLQKDGGAIYEVLFGILIHKWCGAFALGVNLRQKDLTNVKSFTIMTLFAFSSPLGIILGMALAKISSVLTAVFMSISAGVFMHIATGEIMAQEFKTSENFGTKSVFLMLGVTTLTVILGTLKGEHAH